MNGFRQTRHISSQSSPFNIRPYTTNSDYIMILFRFSEKIYIIEFTKSLEVLCLEVCNYSDSNIDDDRRIQLRRGVVEIRQQVRICGDIRLYFLQHTSHDIQRIPASILLGRNPLYSKNFCLSSHPLNSVYRPG